MAIPPDARMLRWDTNMLVSEKTQKIKSRRKKKKKLSLPTQNPNASQWNIGCVGSLALGLCVGHVHFIFFVSISFASGTRRKPIFQWNMGLKLVMLMLKWNRQLIIFFFFLFFNLYIFYQTMGFPYKQENPKSENNFVVDMSKMSPPPPPPPPKKKRSFFDNSWHFTTSVPEFGQMSVCIFVNLRKFKVCIFILLPQKANYKIVNIMLIVCASSK